MEAFKRLLEDRDAAVAYHAAAFMVDALRKARRNTACCCCCCYSHYYSPAAALPMLSLPRAPAHRRCRPSTRRIKAQPLLWRLKGEHNDHPYVHMRALSAASAVVRARVRVCARACGVGGDCRRAAGGQVA